MAIALNGTDKERITKMFKALAEGGYLMDKFGINRVVTVEA